MRRGVPACAVLAACLALGGGVATAADPPAAGDGRASLGLLEAEPPAADPGATLVFERSYDLLVGDKGEDRFELPYAPPACGRPGFAFDSAEIVYVSRRFGEAQVVSTPEPGCVRCGPVVVRRYHEPTGKLHYRLRVLRRTVVRPCAGEGG